MKVDKNEKISGIRIIDIRNFLRRMRNWPFFTAIYVEKYFNISHKVAFELLAELKKAGYINEKDADKYEVSIKGNALSMTRFVPRMSKEKADKVFAGFMKRVETVNNDSRFIFRVSKLILFGSYINPAAPDIGDIDIAYELKKKINDDNEFKDACNAIINEAIANGKCFSDIVCKMFYPQEIVLKYLRNKSPYISLHTTDDDVLKTAIQKQVYP